MDKNNDFVIDNNVAEIKSIHDKFDIKNLDTNLNSILRVSLPDSFSINDLKDISPK